MKTFILVRHAKSSWANPDQSDFDRPLNERGRRDAPEMAKRLLEKKISIDQIIYSPAVRTTETMQFFRQTLNIDILNCVAIEQLYHAPAFVIREQILKLEDHLQTVILIGHNPGITEFANTLTRIQTDNMPTCSMFGVQLATNQWKDLPEKINSFLFYDYPKLKP